MNKYHLFLCIIVITVTGCIKQNINTPHTYPKVTTIVEGRITSKYTHKPVEGVTVRLEGHKPYESTGICLFCPDTTYYDIASTVTDANGNYHLEGTTDQNLSSTMVWSNATYYGYWVTKGTSNYSINFDGIEYIILKEHFHVINNTMPPLAVSIPIGDGIWIKAVDTSFTLYGASLDTGVTAYNQYNYKNNGVERYKSEMLHIGAYADTLTYNFTVDPSTF